MEYYHYDRWEELDYNDVMLSVERNEKSAKTKLAWLLLSGFGGVSIDKEQAVELLKEEVEKDNDEAMWMLGLCYEYGLGTKQNDSIAESLYRRSGERKNCTSDLFSDVNCAYYRDQTKRILKGRGLFLNT